jgi:hypothetical protein
MPENAFSSQAALTLRALGRQLELNQLHVI